MFTRAFLKAKIAEYFQPIQTTLSKLIEIYDSTLKALFSLEIFYNDQGKRQIFENSRISALYLLIPIFIYSLLMGILFTTLTFPAVLLCLYHIMMMICLFFTIVDIIAHRIPDDLMKKRKNKWEMSNFNEIFDFYPPDFGDEIYEVKIASRQQEVTEKLSILNNLRKESFSEQKLIREKIKTFSQGEFAKSPEKYKDKAKSLTEEKKRIDAVTEKHKTDYESARKLALRFHYQAPDTKKL